MAFETVGITSSRNAGSPIVGFRQDLVAGDVVTLTLTSMVGVASVQWDLLGRPEGSAAGGAGVPSILGTGSSASFTVDADALPFRIDGSYKVQATINPGAPSQTRKTVVVARTTGLFVPGASGALLPLRRIAGYEAGEDTSLVAIVQGWATQLNRWLGRLGFRVVTAAAATYAILDTDDTILADATGGAFTATLPTAVGRAGRRFTVKRVNAGGNAVTIGSAGGTIDGAGTVALGAQWASRTVESNGTSWFVVATV